MTDGVIEGEVVQPVAEGATGDPTQGAPAAGEAKGAEGAPVTGGAEDAADAADAAKDADADPLAAYADLKVELAEGLPIDEDGLAELKAFAAENKLAPEAVQGFLNLYAGRVQAQYEAHAAEVASWVEAVKTDPEVGGDKLQASLAVAHKARDAFASPELVELLDATGLGNHPAVVKFFVNAGKAISEDKLVLGSPGITAPRDPARTLFPSMN